MLMNEFRITLTEEYIQIAMRFNMHQLLIYMDIDM